MDHDLDAVLENLSNIDEFSTYQNQSDENSVYKNVSFALSFVTLTFAVTGAVTNSVSVFVYSRPAMRSSMNLLLAGMAAFDLVFSILSIPTFVAPPICLYVYKSDEWSLSCAVTTYSTLYVYPFTNVAKTSSVWTLVYITVQRWFIVRRPFRRARGSSLSLANRALFLIFLAASIYNAPRFFEHQHNDSESWVKEYLREDPFYMSVYYSILYLLTHFIVPFTILAFINGTMTCTIRRALKQQRALSHSEKAAAMMATVVLVFVACNTLPFVMNFVEFVDRDLFTRSETKVCLFALNDLSNILLLINASSTALIYYFCNQKYAHILKRYLIESYRLAKERFNYSSPRRHRIRTVTSSQNGVRIRANGRWYRRRSSSPRPPPYAVHAAKAARMYRCRDDQDPNRFDASPKCSLIVPDYRRRPQRKRSRSVVITWRSTGRMRSNTMGRSFSNTALTMADQIRRPSSRVRFSTAGVVFGAQSPLKPTIRGQDLNRNQQDWMSMRSLI